MPNKDSLDLKKRIQISVSWVVNSGSDRKKKETRRKQKEARRELKGNEVKGGIFCKEGHGKGSSKVTG